MNTPLPPDYHTHTHLCRHAGGMPIDYARVAAERGITEIACTDHIPFPNDPCPAIRMTKEDFQVYLKGVKEAQEAGFCTVLLGVEADYQRDLVSGHIQAVLDTADFDIVLGSLHTGPFWDLTPDDPAATPEFVEQMWQTYFLRMAELARTGLYDVCAHFDIVKRTGVRSTEALMKEKERDIPLTFGSDAHNPDQVGQFFEEAVTLARTAGFTHRASFRKRKKTLVPI